MFSRPPASGLNQKSSVRDLSWKGSQVNLPLADVGGVQGRGNLFILDNLDEYHVVENNGQFTAVYHQPRLPRRCVLSALEARLSP